MLCELLLQSFVSTVAQMVRQQSQIVGLLTVRSALYYYFWRESCQPHFQSVKSIMLPGVTSGGSPTFPGLLGETVFLDLTDSFDDANYVSASCKPQFDRSGGEFSGEGNSGHRPVTSLKTEGIPRPLFHKPEKLQPDKYVLNEYKGNDVAILQILAIIS